jgi:hypothetical protein
LIVLAIGPVLSKGQSWNHVAGTGPSSDALGISKSRIPVIAVNHEDGICHTQDHHDKLSVWSNLIPDQEDGRVPVSHTLPSRFRLIIEVNEDHDAGIILLNLLNWRYNDDNVVDNPIGSDHVRLLVARLSVRNDVNVLSDSPICPVSCVSLRSKLCNEVYHASHNGIAVLRGLVDKLRPVSVSDSHVKPGSEVRLLLYKSKI